MANGSGVRENGGIINGFLANGTSAAKASDWFMKVVLIALLPVMGWSLKTTISIDKRVAVIESGYTATDGSILREQVAELRIDVAREQQRGIAVENDLEEIKQLLRDHVLISNSTESGGPASSSSNHQ